MADNSFKIKNSLVLTPVDLATLTNPQAGDLACDINDSNKIKRYDAASTSWTEVGSGGVGGVDIFFVQDFESVSLSSFTQTGLVLSQTEPLKGKVSALLTHQAAINQSFKQVIPVDRKFRGETMTLRLNAKSNASAGNVTINIYDETNAANLVASQQLQLSNDVSGAISRVGFTIPETCASISYTITALPEAGSPVTRIDDIIAELAITSLLETAVEVPNVTGWQGYTPTFQGFGTPTNVEFEWRQVGESVEIRGKFTSGTPTAVEARVGLPAGLTSAGTSLIPSIQVVGKGNVNISSTTQFSGRTVIIEPNVSYVTFGAESSVDNGIAKALASTLVSSGTSLSFFASVPCAGLSATSTKTIPLTQSGLVQHADSSIKLRNFSSYGSTATKIPRFSTLDLTLGSNITYIDSPTDGASFTIQTSGTYTFNFGFSANTVHAIALSKNPTIGQKTTNASSLTGSEILARSAGIAGNTSGYVSWTGELLAGDIVYPHTDGVASSGGNESRAIISASRQGSLKQVAVSSDQKITIPTSELRFEGSSSRGSTATTIVRFDTLAKLRGDAFTVESDAVLGTRITMKKDGKLDITTSIRQSSSATYFAITRNQANLTAVATTGNEVLAFTTTDSATAYDGMAWSGFVSVGDIIRVCAGANPSSDGSQSLNLSFQEQDISVSVTNTLPQFSESDSSVRVDTANGYGSTGTKIRRFSNTRDNIGSDINYVDDAASGASFTVRTSGVYEISYTENTSGTVAYFAITKNASSLTTNPDGLTSAERLALGIVSTAGYPVTISAQAYLTAGDIIRPQSSAQAAGTNAFVSFTISKVGKPNVTGVNVTPFVNVPQPESQSVFINSTTSVTNNGFGGVPTTQTGSGLFSYNTNGVITFLKECRVSGTISFNTATNATVIASVRKNSSTIIQSASTLASANTFASMGVDDVFYPGETLNYQQDSGTATNNYKFSFLATALSDQILTAPETFSTDTAALTYAGSGAYTLSTLQNAPVGTYITFTYAANTNTRTQTTTRPTQTDADMNANGLLVYTRAFNAASTAAQPAAIAIQIGKGLKGVTQSLYKSAGKVISGDTRYLIKSTTIEAGLRYEDYNEVTGILTLDAGVNTNNTTTTRAFDFSDISSQTSGYLVINASKNPSIVGLGLQTVAAMGVSSTGQSMPNTGLNTVVWNTIKNYDTHGALNTATGVFTAPETGYYQASWMLTFSAQTYAIGNQVTAYLVKNGQLYAQGEFITADRAATFFVSSGGACAIFLAKGDTAEIRASNTRTAGATPLDSGSTNTFFSIVKTSIGTGN